MQGKARRVGHRVSECDVGHGPGPTQDTDTHVLSVRKLHDRLDHIGAGGYLEDHWLHGGGVTAFGDHNGRLGLVLGPRWSASWFLGYLWD